MGLFDGKSHSTSELPRTSGVHVRSGSHRSGSPPRSASGRSAGGYFVRPSANSSSSSHGSYSGFFGSASRGIFGGGGSGSSFYKRRPRSGYIQYLLHKLQRMLKELWAYVKKNPVKAFFAVVVPLLSAGGAIHGLLRQFGVRIPLVDGQASRGGGGYYGSTGYGGGLGGELGGVLGGLGGSAGGSGGWMDNAGSLMQVAKMFM